MEDHVEPNQDDHSLDQGQIDALMTMAKFDAETQAGPKSTLWTKKKIFWLLVVASSIVSLFLF
jgi:hypothetical protein